MRRILAELQAHPLAWAFLQPVNGDEVADYYSVIKQPMGTSARFGAHFSSSLVPLYFTYRLQHNGTQTRNKPISEYGRFRRRCETGIS